MNWLEVFKTVGLPIAYLGVTIWFIKYMLWPLLEKLRLEVSKRTDDFLVALQTRDTITAQQTIILQKLSISIEEYRTELRRLKANKN